MRHRVAKKKLGRTTSHRVALIKNLATSLIMGEKIETTLAKAKFVKPYIEKLITRVKHDSTYNTVRYLNTKLQTEESIKKLMSDVAPRFTNRPGGYTRLVRTKIRDGDNAVLARIEFVEKKKAAKVEKVTKTKKEVKEVKAEVVSKEENAK